MDSDALQQAKTHLEKGELVAIPTETVYGLAANALDAAAVAKIFQAKNRPNFDPLIVHCHSIEQVRTLVSKFPAKAEKFARRFWPGPLTIILPKTRIVPDLVTSGLPSVAVRIPRHPLTLQLLRSLDFPLAAPSANPFGYVSPTKAAHVTAQLGDKIAQVLDGGECQVGIESTIVSFTEPNPIVYRLGGLSLEQINKDLGKVSLRPHSSSNPQAPGMLASHYAPKKRIILGDIKQNLSKVLGQYEAKSVGILSFSDVFAEIANGQQVRLSEKRDFAEAAQRLFAALRYLDTLPIELILAELLPEEDLGRAINDRLRRAASK